MIKLEKNAFPVIMRAVEQMTEFIAPTFGPSGNKVIIEKNLYRMVVDDGVQIARDFALEDPFENAVVKVIRETAIKTNDRVGDGTTGALIMLRAIMREIDKQNMKDGRAISEELRYAVLEATGQLRRKAKRISSQADLEAVARISFDNKEIAAMIASLLHKVGTDGVIAMDQSNTLETTSEHVDGLEIKQGYVSHYMVTDPQRMEAQLERPYILVTKYRLTNANDILPIMNKVIEAGKREMLLVCDNIESDALATAVANRMKGSFTCVAIQAPQGPEKVQFLQDLALMTGATLFSEETGKRLDTATVDMLGKAERAVVRQDKTTIIGVKGKKAEIEKEKFRIKDLLAGDIKDAAKRDLELRLARLKNGVAVVKVGAPTENEQKSLKYKVEDALDATTAAMYGGVVAGGGIALLDIKTSSPLLNKALKEPHRQLLANMGIDNLAIKPGQAYNVVTKETGDFMKIGVIDPADVLIAGIESAASIASQLVTSKGLLVEIKDPE